MMDGFDHNTKDRALVINRQIQYDHDSHSLKVKTNGFYQIAGLNTYDYAMSLA